MATAVAAFLSAADTPLTSPGVLPTINIYRTDTGASVASGSMTEVAGGLYRFDWTSVDGLEYAMVADGDPSATGQTVSGGRYVFASLSGTVTARLETDIPRMLGLQQHLYMLDNTSYDGAGLMTSGRIRIFASQAALNSANPGSIDDADGEIYRYQITATAASPGKADDYVVDLKK